MANLEIEISDLRLPSLTDRDLSGLYKAWATELEKETILAFDREVSPAGVPWQPVSAETVRRREARKSPPTRGKILRDLGNLYDSVFARPVSDGAVVGSNQAVGEYSLLAIHQYGAPRRNIPARPALPMDENGNLIPEVRENLIEIAARFFAD